MTGPRPVRRARFRASPDGGRVALPAAIALAAAILLLPTLLLYLPWRLGPGSSLHDGRAGNGSGAAGNAAAAGVHHDFATAGNLSLRFYNSTGPHNGKIAGLQKGAILLNGENETVGEGAGFGAPVLDWNGTTYFSRTARTALIPGGIAKTFVLDTVETGPAYHTSFVAAPPAGEAEVSYRLNGSTLSVSVNVSRLPRNATLAVLNEQAGSVYRRFVDFDSLDLTVNFSWKRVTGRYNYLLDSRGRGFRVDYTPAFYGSSALYLGREIGPAGFDWAGLDYVVDLSSIGGDRFSYEVHLVGG